MRASEAGRRKAEVFLKGPAVEEQGWVAGKWQSSFQLTLFCIHRGPRPHGWEPCVGSSVDQGRAQKHSDARAWDGAEEHRQARRGWRGSTRCPKSVQRGNSDLKPVIFR